MRRLVALWRNLFDVRPGEYRRTVFMALYLLFVLFAYYVLKSASESMFLNKFDIDKLPNLYILLAVFGGVLAYVYSKVAARTSLNTAVTWTLFLSIACLIAMWFPLRYRQPAMVYTFAVWVRLFSVVTVTQGWVVATNLFNAREAKRVYGLLGMGMVVVRPSAASSPPTWSALPAPTIFCSPVRRASCWRTGRISWRCRAGARCGPRRRKPSLSISRFETWRATSPATGTCRF